MADITKAQTARIEKHLNQKIWLKTNIKADIVTRKERVNLLITTERGECRVPHAYLECTWDKDGVFHGNTLFYAPNEKEAERGGARKCRPAYALKRADDLLSPITKTEYEYALVAFKYFNQNKTLGEIMEKYGLTIFQATELLDKATELLDKYKIFLPKI